MGGLFAGLLKIDLNKATGITGKEIDDEYGQVAAFKLRMSFKEHRESRGCSG